MQWLIFTYILSVYSPFSDRVGLTLHNTPFPGVLMKSIGAAFFRPDALPDVNHMYNDIEQVHPHLLYQCVCSVNID